MGSTASRTLKLAESPNWKVEKVEFAELKIEDFWPFLDDFARFLAIFDEIVEKMHKNTRNRGKNLKKHPKFIKNDFILNKINSRNSAFQFGDSGNYKGEGGGLKKKEVKIVVPIIRPICADNYWVRSKTDQRKIPTYN